LAKVASILILLTYFKSIIPAFYFFKILPSKQVPIKTQNMKKWLFMAALLVAQQASAQDLQLNDKEYFERQGVNVLVFSNSFNGGFNDEKNSGIEIIQHGVRAIQGGAVRLNNTPEQWDLVPKMTYRKVDRQQGTIEVGLRYDDYDFDSRIVVTQQGKAVEIAVFLDHPVPESLAGEAGFNLEFLPSRYWLKTFTMDGRLNRFPRYATSRTVARPNSQKPRQFKGFKTYDDRGTDRFVDPLPLEGGHKISMAIDDPERMVTVTSPDSLLLYDGRMLAQNGWFVLRSVLPKGKVGKVLSWTVTPNAINGWKRQPNIGFSQVGYLPEQPKVSVIELDIQDRPQATAALMRIGEDGSVTKAFEGPLHTWGPYYKYNYVKFDFSAVRQPGIYYIQYGETRTGNFLIDNHVYDKITDATTDVWVPIHMNHMYVNEGYRTWHGEPFREGYLQAPPSDHFDLHRQGPTTDTKYKPLELIPGLNVGGFFDAGDFDIETGSNINVVQNFIRTWELFHPQRDETFVSQQQRYVDLHRPDGKPDILQFIEHGTLNLVAQAEQIGHMASTLSNSVLDNYHHLGDAASITDGLHYDPSLKPYEKSADGKRSGTPDDLWAFTTRNPSLDFQAATMFAAASRALQGYNDSLAQRALTQSERLMREATEIMQQRAGQTQTRTTERNRRNNNRQSMGNMGTNLQLYAATHNTDYRDRFLQQIWTQLDRSVERNMQTALDAIPYMDDAYKQRLRPYVSRYAEYIRTFDQQNPYGVPIGLGNWAGGNQILNFGTTVCFASLYYPDIVSKDETYRVANWLYGCHPYHNYSFVAVVGAARPKQVFYGNNRADFSFIPGNVAPGLLFRQPDHFENFDDWPFLWGQNEGTIAGNTQYIIFGSAFKGIHKQ
jgi:endoglucanase